MNTREDKRMVELDFGVFQNCLFVSIYYKINLFFWGECSFLLVHIQFTLSEGPQKLQTGFF